MTAANIVPFPKAQKDGEQALAIRGQSTSIAEQANALIVKDAESYQASIGTLQTIAAMKDAVVNYWKPIKDAAHKAHRQICNAEKEMITPLDTASASLNRRASAWKQVETEREAAAQRQADLEAKKREEEIRLQQAVEAEQRGESAEYIEQVLQTPVFVAPTEVEKMVPKVDGAGDSTRYWAEIDNLMELVKAVAAGRAPLDAIEANMVYLNAKARKEKEAMSVPGVKLGKETKLRVSHV